MRLNLCRMRTGRPVASPAPFRSEPKRRRDDEPEPGEHLEAALGILVEALEPEIAADAQRLLPLRLRAARMVEEQHRSQLELARQMIDDPERSDSLPPVEPNGARVVVSRRLRCPNFRPRRR
jgi:hypothetical protein